MSWCVQNVYIVFLKKVRCSRRIYNKKQLHITSLLNLSIRNTYRPVDLKIFLRNCLRKDREDHILPIQHSPILKNKRKNMNILDASAQKLTAWNFIANVSPKEESVIETASVWDARITPRTIMKSIMPSKWQIIEIQGISKEYLHLFQHASVHVKNHHAAKIIVNATGQA